MPIPSSSFLLIWWKKLKWFYTFFGILKIETGDYSADYFKSTAAIGTSGSYINYREVFGRFSMTKGSYIIIPATFLPNTEAEFLLRIFSQEKIHLEEIKI